MPPLPPVVVKWGGSVITRKSGSSALRRKVLTNLALDLARVPEEQPVILLHGAGSFGHPGAVRWGLAEPPRPTDTRFAHRRRGAAIVQAEVRRLHGMVLRSLLEAGLSPCSIPPNVIARNRSGRLVALDLTPVREGLARSVTPVSFGDVVFDEEWGFSILSADTLAVEMVAKLGVRRVIFVSDVPGVLDPALGGRTRIAARATPDLLDRLVPVQGRADVTGGIRGKVQAMLAIRDLGADAGLISGLSDGALSRAVRGEKVYGTWTQGETS